MGWLTNKISQAADGANDIGQIIRFMFTPCGYQPLLWAEAAVPSLMHMFATIVEPDPKELYHRVVGKSLVCSLKTGIVDAQEAESVLGNFGKRFVFTASEFADESIWYAFLANVAAEGLVDWTSQIIKFSGCTGSKDGSSSDAYGGVPDSTGAAIANGFDWVFQEGSKYWPVSPATVGIRRGKTGTLGWAATVCNGQGIPLPSMSWLERDSDGKQWDHQYSALNSDGQPTGTAHFGTYANPSTGPLNDTIKVKCIVQGQVPDHVGFFKHGMFFKYED